MCLWRISFQLFVMEKTNSGCDKSQYLRDNNVISFDSRRVSAMLKRTIEHKFNKITEIHKYEQKKRNTEKVHP